MNVSTIASLAIVVVSVVGCEPASDVQTGQLTQASALGSPPNADEQAALCAAAADWVRMDSAEHGSRNWTSRMLYTTPDGSYPSSPGEIAIDTSAEGHGTGRNVAVKKNANGTMTASSGDRYDADGDGTTTPTEMGYNGGGAAYHICPASKTPTCTSPGFCVTNANTITCGATSYKTWECKVCREADGEQGVAGT
jgi:hypothetical protein